MERLLDFALGLLVMASVMMVVTALASIYLGLI